MWIDHDLVSSNESPGCAPVLLVPADMAMSGALRLHARADATRSRTYQLLTALPTQMTPTAASFCDAADQTWHQCHLHSGQQLLRPAATQTFSINTVGPPLSDRPTSSCLATPPTRSPLTWDPTAFVLPLTYQVYQRTFLHNRGVARTTSIVRVTGSSTNSATSVDSLRFGSHLCSKPARWSHVRLQSGHWRRRAGSGGAAVVAHLRGGGFSHDADCANQNQPDSAHHQSSRYPRPGDHRNQPVPRALHSPSRTPRHPVSDGFYRVVSRSQGPINKRNISAGLVITDGQAKNNISRHRLSRHGQ